MPSRSSAIGAPRLALLGIYIGTPAAVLGAIEDPERFSHLILHSPVDGAPHGGSSATHREEHELSDEVAAGLLRMGWQYHHEPARRALLTLIAPEADTDTLHNLAEAMHCRR